MVVDGHFVDAAFLFGDFGGDLDLEPETVLLDLDLFQHLATEDFVADLHVGEVQVGHHVREQGQQFVADHVPEEVDAVGTAAREARAEYDVGMALEDRSEQGGVVARIVFEVGVLNKHDVPGGGREPGAQGRALALVDLVVADDQRRILLVELVDRLAGPVARAIVDKDDFLLQRKRHGLHGVHDFTDGFFLVEDRDDDRDFHVARSLRMRPCNGNNFEAAPWTLRGIAASRYARPRMHTIIVTGAEGFLGRSAVARLAGEGWTVLAVDRVPHAGPALTGVAYHMSDLSDPATLVPPGFNSSRFILLHLAWDMRRFEGYAPQAGQVELFAALLDAWAGRGLDRVIAMASAEEYGGLSGLISESATPVFPLSPYGWSKRAARDLVGSWSPRTGIPAILLRPFIMYGPGQRGDMLIPSAIAAARRREKTAFTDGRQRRDFVYIDDVVEAIVLAARSALTGFHEFNLGGGEGVPVADILMAIARHVGAEAFFDLGARPRRPGEPDLQAADITRARDVLGWRPSIAWPDGLARCLSSMPAPHG